VDYILGEAVENPEAEDQQEIYLQAA